MARIRSVHPGFFTDAAYAFLSDAAQVLVIGLWTECDDQGAFVWSPNDLKLRLRPGKDGSVAPLLEELEASNIIMSYEHEGRKYGLVRNFKRYQRPKKPNSVHFIPPEFRTYTGSTHVSGELEQVKAPSVPPKGEKSKQMEDGGWRMKDGRGKDKHQAAASTATGHAAAAALRKRLVEIAGDAFVSDRASEDISPILDILGAGANLDRDVLPVIVEFASRPRTLSTWKPVAMEINARMKAAFASKPLNLDNPEQVNWPLMVANFRKREDLARSQGKHKAPAYAWSAELGPRPDEPGCKAPADVLLSHGYGENAA